MMALTPISKSTTRYTLLRHQLIGSGEQQVAKFMSKVQIHHWALSVENDFGLDHVYELDIGMSSGSKLRPNNITFMEFKKLRRKRAQKYNSVGLKKLFLKKKSKKKMPVFGSKHLFLGIFR